MINNRVIVLTFTILFLISFVIAVDYRIPGTFNLKEGDRVYFNSLDYGREVSFGVAYVKDNEVRFTLPTPGGGFSLINGQVSNYGGDIDTPMTITVEDINSVNGIASVKFELLPNLNNQNSVDLKGNSTIYYILGGVVIFIILLVIYFVFRNKR
ncbi:MAG: hypothetical protein WC584_04160 [Candidatus Pacearchaeota archaeon]